MSVMLEDFSKNGAVLGIVTRAPPVRYEGTIMPTRFVRSGDNCFEGRYAEIKPLNLGM